MHDQLNTVSTRDCPIMLSCSHDRLLLEVSFFFAVGIATTVQVGIPNIVVRRRSSECVVLARWDWIRDG